MQELVFRTQQTLDFTDVKKKSTFFGENRGMTQSRNGGPLSLTVTIQRFQKSTL